MDSKDLSYITQPDWWGHATISNVPALAQDAGKDMALTRTGVGVYVATIGSGGIDAAHRRIVVDVDVAGIVQVVDTSDTVKTITLLSNAGAAIEAGNITVSIFRQIG